MSVCRSRLGYFTLIVLVSIVAGGAGAPSSIGRLGAYVVTGGDFPTAKSTVGIPFVGGDLETSDRPPGWPTGGEIVTGANAPQGRRYTGMPAHKGGILMTPAVRVVPNRPHFLSFCLKAPVSVCATISSHADFRLVSFDDHYPAGPDTAGRWRHMGNCVPAPAPT